MGEAAIIDGKAFAAALRARVAAHVAKLREAHGLVPGLAVVLVGDDPASEVYVASKGRATLQAGMASFEHRLPDDTAEADLVALVERLNGDAAVHGILVQLPLPPHIDAARVIEAIDPAKDVDGLHPVNAGRLASGEDAMVPCTPLGCLLLLRDRLGDMNGMEAVVVGRSNLVGRPMAALLLREGCTVTVCHSRTRDLAAHTRRADILVAAVGRPRMLGADHVKPGAAVIDVGINRIAAPERGPGPDPGRGPGRGDGATRLVGDVDFDNVLPVAGSLTPVPGGVGPMTIACLLANTLTAATRANGLPVPDGLAA